MKKSAIILKSSYNKRSFQSLADFASNVASKMSAEPAFATIGREIAELQTLTVAFSNAVSLAQDRAISHVRLKNRLKKEVIFALDRIVGWLNWMAKGDPHWCIEAGFDEPPKAKKSKSKGIQPPFKVSVQSYGLKGEVLVKFRLPACRQVVTNAVEYSTDFGTTWHDGGFGNSRGVRLTNLPSNQVVQIKVRSLGSKTRVSGWSEIVTVYVG